MNMYSTWEIWESKHTKHKRTVDREAQIFEYK